MEKLKTPVYDLDILSKRIIAWISNSKIAYDESDNKYKNNGEFLRTFFLKKERI